MNKPLTEDEYAAALEQQIEEEREKIEKAKRVPTPKEIKEYLDKYVIGQEEAKRVLSVAVYNHYKKVYFNLYEKNTNDLDMELDKSNIILLGNTGCGKTLMMKTIAKLLGVPCYIQDCTKITASGYVGSDVEDCLVGLLRACNYDMEAAERGIIVLDEGDKIAKKEAGVSVVRDVSGECVQQSLLKIVEGDIVGVPPMGGRKHPEQPLLYINTKNILFVLSGAFSGLDDIIKRRVGGKTIGFDTNVKEEKEKIDGSYESFATPQDLRTFGFIPEFIGRFPIITNVEKLSVDDLVTVLTEPKNSIIKQYQAMLAFDNVDLRFTKDGLKEIAKLAYSLETGARGLRTIVETVMFEIMYDAPSHIGEKEPFVLTVNAKTVLERTAKKYKSIKIAE